ncbi:hypothetical protein GCM10027040_08270 [Halomonas shantousis]
MADDSCPALTRTPDAWRQALSRFVRVIPHTRELGLEVVEAAPPMVRMRLPWHDDLQGDSRRGLVHGGVLSMLLDTLCGSAVLCGLPSPEVCPTLDLRVDHFRPAMSGRDLFGEARVVHVTASMVFTEGTLWQEEGRPVARGVGNFVRLGERNTPPGFAAALFGDDASGERK